MPLSIKLCAYSLLRTVQQGRPFSPWLVHLYTKAIASTRGP